MPREKIGRVIVCCVALIVAGVIESVALLRGIDGATLKLFFTLIGGIVGFVFGRLFPGKKSED